MRPSWHEPRCLSGDALAAALRDSRARTLSLVLELDDAQWRMPQRAGVNPVAWELAHVAWFARHWVCGEPSHPLFDSARLPHAERWNVALPARDEVLAQLEGALADVLAALPAGDDERALYFHRLVLFHEDMHAEAFCWMRAALGYPAPLGLEPPRPAAGAGRVRCAGGETLLGRPRGAPGFWFDNEQPGASAALAPFEIDRVPVTQGAYARFVEAGGPPPERWRRGAAGWEQRWFDRWLPVEPHAPVVHVDAYEAAAYAQWAGRRLPSAAEWAFAEPQLEWGQVWEWTASDFQPYPGFVPGPYADYSAPWFGDHRELRGASVASHARMRHPAYRNFFLPQRRDLFTGFRTAADL